MTFGRMTDYDIGKHSINFGHDPDYDRDLRSGKKYFQYHERFLLFQERNLLVMRPLADATSSFGRTFGRE